MHLAEILQTKLSETFSKIEAISVQPVGGGSINEAYHISFSGMSVFCKVNSATKFPHLFIKEKKGLRLLAEKEIIKTPSIIDCFVYDDKQVLLLEWIEEGKRTGNFWIAFGEQLALLHRQRADFYGLDEDNYMGSVLQSNTKHTNWNQFFAVERLSPLIKKCTAKNLLTKSHILEFEALVKKLDSIFEQEQPCLLHGDLWGGNFICNHNAEPVIIDPAVYYGHRSVDLGMTTLFGGFSQPFYEAYHYHYPFPTNYKEQWAVCNLYPLLLHLYLFGSSYLPQLQTILKQFA